MLYNRGSEWRKWDLHVHTASSYDATYKCEDSDELLVKAWRNHGLAAVAITDHFLIDDARISNLRALAPEITIFPGFEMRTDKGAPNLHVIAIFSETTDLITLKNDFEAILMRQYKKEDETNDTIVRDFSNIVDFVKQHNGILTIHAGKKTNGIDKEITNALEVAQAIKKDIASNIDMFEIGRLEDINSYKNHVFKAIDEKPLILCSDNHDPRDYKVKEYLWIKANPTFQGLIQTIMQPSERVFIGTIPDKLDKLNKNKSSHIKNITVSRIPNPTISHEHWFDSTLDLNPSLIAIIGNKGSGKSALSDILGHICKSKNMLAASFLNSDRFRKPPEKKANDYFATIQWYDGKTEKDISLGAITRDTTIEEAQYLPQKYIESVCNDLSDEFQTEIDQVIFSYVDPSERGDATNLAELIENKSISIHARITELKNTLDICNKEIIRLEDRKTTQYKSTVAANLAKRKEDLERHDNSKPTEVKKPEKENNAEYENKLQGIKNNIELLESEQSKHQEELTKLNTRIDQNKSLNESLVLLSERITSVKTQLDEYANLYGLSTDKFALTCALPLESLKTDLANLLVRKDEIKLLLDESETAGEISIARKIRTAKEELKALISSTDGEERAYQKYIADLKEWETLRNEIIGDSSKDGSLKYYENELEYIEQRLDALYSEKQSERKTLISKIFEQKKLSSDIYQELYKPIERKLVPLLENTDDKIEFNISLTLKYKDIGTRLLNHINQQLTGVFRGKSESSALMAEYIQATNFNDLNSLTLFIDNVLNCIYEDIDKSTLKVKEKLDFYNLLSSLDYIKAEYSLTLGNRPLSMLSPGERGIVLLVFYLALSKNDIPLIIDQPEDNLDNQSVYARLVPCIREAKKKRQVIIVTHNPNIAIACDAEQVVCCSIDKTDNHITYLSGGIEDKEIRNTVVDILEGTMPAFELRKMKYTYNLYDKA